MSLPYTGQQYTDINGQLIGYASAINATSGSYTQFTFNDGSDAGWLRNTPGDNMTFELDTVDGLPMGFVFPNSDNPQPPSNDTSTVPGWVPVPPPPSPPSYDQVWYDPESNLVGYIYATIPLGGRAIDYVQIEDYNGMVMGYIRAQYRTPCVIPALSKYHDWIGFISPTPL
jgi:hypothetical protein